MTNRAELQSVGMQEKSPDMDKWNLAKISRERYAEFVRAAQSSLTLRKIIDNALMGDFTGNPFPEEAFHAVYRWWVQFERTKALMVRFNTAIESEYVPKREKQKATRIFVSLEESFNHIVEPLQSIVQKASIQDDEAQEIAAKIRVFEIVWSQAEQVLALCEAIDQSALTDPLEIRQYIAQHALEELSEAFLYENLYYAADVSQSADVVDDLETERRELLAALLRGEWDEKKRKTMQEQYEQWRPKVRGLADGEVSRDFTLLWNAVSGKKLDTQDAITILGVQARIFETLRDEGALEWELDDEEDEDMTDEA